MRDATALSSELPASGSRRKGPSLSTAIIFFVLAFVVGVGLKIALGASAPGISGPDRTQEVAALLQKNGFRVLPSQAGPDARQVVGLGTFGCRVTVVQAKTQGWDQHSVRNLSQPGDDYFVVFQGALYDEHPRWMVRAYGYWDRLRRHVGILPPDRPVFAVIASPTCSVRSLPWQDLT